MTPPIPDALLERARKKLGNAPYGLEDIARFAQEYGDERLEVLRDVAAALLRTRQLDGQAKALVLVGRLELDRLEAVVGQRGEVTE